MKKQYSLFYSYKNIGDVLIVIFDNDKKPTRSERKGNVEVIYNQEDIIGYNIFDIRNIVKIKTEGLIYLPSPALIGVINTILMNNKVEELAPMVESGYVIGEVKNIQQIDAEKTLIFVDIGKDLAKAIVKNNALKEHDKVVVATLGTRLNNGETIKASSLGENTINAHLCSEKELQISEENKVLVLDKEEEIGKDFFTTEAR